MSIPIITTELCSYGCGAVAKFKNKSNKLMCCVSANSCPSNRNKNGLANRGKSRKGGCRVAWNKGKTKHNDIRIRKYSETLKNKLENGELIPCGCCAWTIEERSLKAKKQNFGGYRNHSGRSKNMW